MNIINNKANQGVQGLKAFIWSFFKLKKDLGAVTLDPWSNCNKCISSEKQ